MFDIWQEIYGTIKRNKLRTFLTGFAVAWAFYAYRVVGCRKRYHPRLRAIVLRTCIELYPHFPGWTSKPYAGLKEGRRVRLENNDLEATESISGLCNQCRCYRAAEQCKRQFGQEYVNIS